MADYRTQTTLPRGIRNNNPGNIKAGIAWQGAVGDDGTFTIFADTTWGLRAVGVDLTSKINRGLTTITDIISAYAPPSENNTAAYISAVSGDTGFGPDDELAADPTTLALLIRAIVNHENGPTASSQYVSDEDIATGVNMINGGAAQLFQASTIAVEANPTQSLLVAIGVVIVLDYFWS